MATILPFILIVISLTVIIVLLVRKYPQLTLLDVDSIKEVQLEKKKDEYWKKRVEKNASESRLKLGQSMVPVINKMKGVQRSFRSYVGSIEKRLEKQVAHATSTQKPEAESEKTKDKLRKLMLDAQMAFDAEEYEEAEKKFIRVVSIDAKNEEAYRGLAETYQKLSQKDEARETFAFLVQLNPRDDVTLAKYGDLLEEDGDLDGAVKQYRRAVQMNDHNPARCAKLAQLLQRQGDLDAALEAVHRAVDIEPENPKYLDSLLEISIMVGDKILAEEVWEQLRSVNPDNQKLAVFKDRIAQIRSEA